MPITVTEKAANRVKQIIKDAILSSWDAMSALTFTGWNTCPSSGSFLSVEIFDSQTGGNIKGNTTEFGLGALQAIAAGAFR